MSKSKRLFFLLKGKTDVFLFFYKKGLAVNVELLIFASALRKNGIKSPTKRLFSFSFFCKSLEKTLGGMDGSLYLCAPLLVQRLFFQVFGNQLLRKVKSQKNF